MKEIFVPKWYNTELPLIHAELLQDFLYDTGIKFEKSACYNLYHFEIFVTSQKILDSINDFLRFLPDTI